MMLVGDLIRDEPPYPKEFIPQIYQSLPASPLQILPINLQLHTLIQIVKEHDQSL